MPAKSEFTVVYSPAFAKWVLAGLLAFDTLLIIAYCVTHIVARGPQWGPLVVLLDVDRETSIPTWFSSMQLLAIGLLLIVKTPDTNELRFFLRMVGAGFIFLSADESAAIHEKLVELARKSTVWSLSHWSYIVWIVLYLAIGLFIALFAYRSLLAMWRKYRRETIWGGTGMTILVIGAMGFEVLSRLLYTPDINWRFLAAVAAEEFFEMTGASLILYGTMLLGIRLQLDNPADASH
jgi:hypothetical protein